MQVYLVGGAVRDGILGIEPKDRDYVVVGSSEQELLEQGYQKVGISFPVFIHPDTYEQYALARTEVKTGKGYSGFSVNADARISLVDDLRRRDLTINSMAMDTSTGEIIDPFGGQEDIQKKVLRHTSSAFSEDALRVIRLAAFCARFHGLGFTIDSETFKLCKKMVEEKTLDDIQNIRFWLILGKMLEEPGFDVFMECLNNFGVFAHSKFFKELVEDDKDVKYLEKIASAVNEVCEYSMPTTKVMYFTMSVCRPGSSSVHRFAHKKLHAAFYKLKKHKQPTASKLLNVLMSAKAFEHRNYHLGELTTLTKIQEFAGNKVAVSSATLDQINSALEYIPDHLISEGDGEKTKKQISEHRLGEIKRILAGNVSV